MAISTQETAGGITRLAIDGPLTIYEAAEAKGELLAAVERSGALEFDLGGVEEIDTAGVQLLWLARREADRAGKPLRIAAASNATLEVLGRYGLSADFGLAAAA